jgi:hypothetical protein
MKEEKIDKLMCKFAERVTKSVPSSLAEEIKQRIPHRLIPHKMDTINIIIDLRVNKLTAAAVITATMILLASFFGSRDKTGNGILQDSKMLAQYFFGVGGDKNDMSALKSRYENLIQKGEQAEYYADERSLNDKDAILLQWKLADGKYKVIMGDLREETVTAEELVQLQARMLQKKIKIK